MVTIKQFFKRNRQGMLIGSIVGGVTYFISRGFLPEMNSTLQSGLSPQGLVDQLGFSIEIKIFLFFVSIGFIIGLLIDAVWKPKK